MEERPTSQSGISVQYIMSGLGNLEWASTTDKLVGAQHNIRRAVGYFNPLRSTEICVVSENELEWIYSQTEESLANSPAFDPEKVILFVTCVQCNPGPTMTQLCRKNNIALARTSVSGNEILNFLDAKLPRMAAVRGIEHGVFLAVMNVGVLITGASGVGKSEVAMDLVQRGHQLIADDAVEIFRGDQSDLIGECPEQLKGFIEIRGLGIINVHKMFGPSSVLDSYRLELVIDLKDATNSEIQNVDRLAPSLNDLEILGLNVPCLTMLVAPGRNLSVLVEAAVRDHLLRRAGENSSADFLSRHQFHIENGAQ